MISLIFLGVALKLSLVSDLETALHNYKSVFADVPGQVIWSVAEIYRFEHCKKLVAKIGTMMSVQVIIEGSMNSLKPYFSSFWRRNFTICAL
ncbi:hypothetical protein Ahy_A08g038089 [Arachis hypogaea]|uniref:Uncharacterized protein n=1 Tax=Arachis hypogaea TaxID=3818 RepID=A0A445BSL2_ARAHY|nr:hypothetical protein Ahy_A08g038089 [Arachis hypogaea]